MLLVDVRTQEEYMAGHVPSAVNLPVDAIAKGDLPAASPQEKIVLYCRSGSRAEQAKQMLEMHGFMNVSNGGGYEDIRR